MEPRKLPFGSEVSVTVDDLKSLKKEKKFSSEFNLWLQNKSQKRLSMIANLLIDLGLVKDAKEAILYLDQLSRESLINLNRLTSTDLKGEKQNLTKAQKELRKICGETLNASSNNELYCQFGVVGHLAVPSLLSNQYLEIKKTKTKIQKQISFLKFSRPKAHKQLILFSKNQCSFQTEELKSCWQEMRDVFNSTNLWFEQYRLLYSYLPRIQELLIPVFGDFIQKLDNKNDPVADYFLILTLMSWASALIFMDKNPKSLFSEISAINFREGLGQDRIDALEVFSLNTSAPNVRQRHTLLTIAKEIKKNKGPISVGSLARDLVDFFGEKILFRLIDWKFAIGDAIGNSFTLKAEDLKDPPQKHVKQMKRYLVLASLDFHLISQNNGRKTGRIWSANGHFRSGQLIYFLPNIAPIVHKVKMTSSEQEEFFMDNIALKWEPAKKRSIFRQLDNVFACHLVDVVNGQGCKKSNFIKQKKIFKSKENLFKKTAIGIIKRYKEKRFVDKTKIVERVGRTQKGDIFYRMHLDALVEFIESGKIQTERRFNWDVGGKISCPIHEEIEPSLHIYLERNYFKCFGCGAWGFFDEFSIPENLSHIQISDFRSFGRKNKRTHQLVVSDEHHKIMSRAQEILQNSFKNSPAQDYLAQERFIDLDLAFDYGAGFADDNLIFGLLDYGYSFEQLFYYGFLDVSASNTRFKNLVPVLLKKGMKYEDVKKVINKFKKTNKPGFPYSILQNRITFPLELEGRRTNFYGRAVYPCAKEFRHRKLLTAHTKVHQGGFNMSILKSDSSRVIVVEAVICALTLIQIGILETVAVVGTNNVILMEALARSGKDIEIALDGDISGHRETNVLFKRLAFAEHKAGVNDFTSEFINNHSMPDVFKDYNQWWKNIDRRGYKKQ